MSKSAALLNGITLILAAALGAYIGATPTGQGANVSVSQADVSISGSTG